MMLIMTMMIRRLHLNASRLLVSRLKGRIYSRRHSSGVSRVYVEWCAYNESINSIPHVHIYIYIFAHLRNNIFAIEWTFDFSDSKKDFNLQILPSISATICFFFFNDFFYLFLIINIDHLFSFRFIFIRQYCFYLFHNLSLIDSLSLYIYNILK